MKVWYVTKLFDYWPKIRHSRKWNRRWTHRKFEICYGKLFRSFLRAIVMSDVLLFICGSFFTGEILNMDFHQNYEIIGLVIFDRIYGRATLRWRFFFGKVKFLQIFYPYSIFYSFFTPFPISKFRKPCHGTFDGIFWRSKFSKFLPQKDFLNKNLCGKKCFWGTNLTLLPKMPS